MFFFTAYGFKMDLQSLCHSENCLTNYSAYTQPDGTINAILGIALHFHKGYATRKKGCKVNTVEMG